MNPRVLLAVPLALLDSMDTRLVHFNKPVDIELNGSTTTRRFTPSLKVLCQTLARRTDPGYIFSAEFTVVEDPTAGRLILASTP